MNPFEPPRPQNPTHAESADLPSLAGLLLLVSSFALSIVIFVADGAFGVEMRGGKHVRDGIWLAGVVGVAFGFRHSARRLAAGIGLFAVGSCLIMLSNALVDPNYEISSFVLVGNPLLVAYLAFRARKGRSHLSFPAQLVAFACVTGLVSLSGVTVLSEESTAFLPSAIGALATLAAMTVLHGLVLALLTIEAIRVMR